MKVDTQLIDHLARLSRLQFSDVEKESIRADLEKIISFVDKLGEVDVAGVTPVRHMSNESSVLRHDLAGTPMDAKEALAPASVQWESFFAVPKVLDQ